MAGTMSARAGVMAAALAVAGAAQAVRFSVRPQPEQHQYAVAMSVAGPSGELTDFEMPEWMPGYYGLMHYANYVSHFEARDGAGHALAWERTTESRWRVVSAHAAAVEVSYEVAAPRAFVASNSLDAQGGFIAPPGLFLYVAGRLQEPATVAMHAPAGWSTIATGLDAVPGAVDTFRAPDFDALYDSPWLLGPLETTSFSVRGVPHEIVLEEVPPEVDRAKMAADLRRIVTAATTMMGAVPYRKYVFLMIGRGNGGIEHLNSAAIAFNGRSLLTPAGYQSWLSYVAHEYFHNFNVKRIRPLALGPFDYQTANLTDMLWVAEGLTVYYEDLLVERAGLMTPDEYLGKLQAALDKFENAPGHRYQSATESSLQAWSTGSGVGADRNTSISYYDNGALLGAMLDLAIRAHSHNRASLDSAMRELYQTYAVRDGRGYTDAEFKAACERAAGAPLDEVFSYAATSAEPDYAKYFAYAGLRLTQTTTPAPGAYLGISTQAGASPTTAGRGRGRGMAPPPPLVIRSLDLGSPAAAAGLEVGDLLVTLGGAPITPVALNQALAAGKAGDPVTLGFRRKGGPDQSATVTLGAGRGVQYTLARIEQPTALQAAILRGWMVGR
ncbi:MAG: M61 family metallopeptidase [Terriglobales bacterium]